MRKRSSVTGKPDVAGRETNIATGESNIPGGKPEMVAPKRATRADQDKMLAQEIDLAAVFIAELEADPARRAKIGKMGLSDRKLADGKGLQATAQSDFGARQGAMGTVEQDVDAAKAWEKTDRKSYADIRVVLRDALPDAGARTALGLDGVISTDRQTFITQARTSYMEAKKPRWRTLLDSEGYTIAALDAALARLAALDSLTATAEKSKKAAKDATEARNASYRALRRWVVSVRTRERRS